MVTVKDGGGVFFKCSWFIFRAVESRPFGNKSIVSSEIAHNVCIYSGSLYLAVLAQNGCQIVRMNFSVVLYLAVFAKAAKQID